jgi:predicted patatin/cPLA2 family phospholipase
METFSEDAALLAHLQGRETAPPIRSLLLLLSGGMAGIYGGAIAAALEQCGLVHFTYVVGISAGALTAAYLVAGQAAVGASLYCEELAGKQFINYFRRGKILDLDFAEQLLRQGQKRLHVEAIARSASRLSIGVTSYPDGQGLWLDAQCPTIDPITALKSSAAIPGLYDAPIYPLLGRRCIDGAIAFPFPMCEVVARFQPTHIVVIANHPLHRVSAVPPCEESLFIRTQRHVPEQLRHLMLQRYVRFQEGLAACGHLEGSKVFLLSPPENHLSWLTRNRRRLSQAFHALRQETLRTFASSREGPVAPFALGTTPLSVPVPLEGQASIRKL